MERGPSYIGGFTLGHGWRRLLRSRRAAIALNLDQPIPMRGDSVAIPGDVTVHFHPLVGMLCGGTIRLDEGRTSLEFAADDADIQFRGVFCNGQSRIRGLLNLNVEGGRGCGRMTFEFFDDD